MHCQGKRYYLEQKALFRIVSDCKAEIIENKNPVHLVLDR